MELPMTTYVAFAHHCAFAHRTKDVGLATDLFANLWANLDREFPDDRDSAKATFNATFRKAYHTGWEPGAALVEPAPQPAPAPAPAPYMNRNGCHAGDGSPIIPAARKATGSTVALDCAAFFSSKQKA